MMYIEHTNLEDNLHQILTDRIPSSSSPSASEATAAIAASGLLARVREAHNSAPSTLQQLTNTSSNAQFEDSTPNNHKSTVKGWIRRPEPNLLPLGSRQELQITSNLDANTTPALENHQKKNDQHQQKEDKINDEQYKLLKAIDSERTAKSKSFKYLNLENNLPQQGLQNCASSSKFLTDIKSSRKQFSSDTETITPVSQVQLQDEEFEYVVTRVPKRKLQQLTTSQDLGDNLLLNRRVRKPVPAAIPIDTHQRIRTEPPPVPELIIRQFRRPVPGLKKYIDTLQEHQNSYKGLNGYATAEDFQGEEENYCAYYSDSEAAPTGTSASANSKGFYSRQEDQMGLDILNKIKQIFNWNSSASHYSSAHQEGKRKRRSDDWGVGESVGPQQIKYRKVENRFPKYITTRSEDDLDEFLPPFSHVSQQRKLQNSDKQLLLNNLAQSSRTLLEMSNRRSTSADKPPLRKSIFSSPHITQQLIKNTNYADVEFSDDDEPILIKASVKRVPEVFNIPIIRTDERLKLTQQKPPPPLLEPSTGSILKSSLVPDFETRRKPTYAETLRRNPDTGHVLGRRSSNTSSVASTSESSRILNGLINLRSNHWSTPNRSSILNQEKESEEREKYQQLLEQVVPRLYGSTGVDNKLSFAASSISAAQRRRTPLIFNNAISSSSRSSPAANRRSVGLGQSSLKRPPLSSTINLDDDDDDIVVTGISHSKPLRSAKTKQSVPVTVIVDDDELSDIVDLGNEERHVLSACAKIQKEKNSIINLCEEKVEKPKKEALPFVEPVNSLQERLSASPHIKENWLENFQSKWLQRKKNRHDEVKETVKVTEKLTAQRRAAEAEIQERLRKFQIVDPELLVVDDFEDAVEEPEFVDLAQKEYRARINAAVYGPLDQILVSKFNLNITRRDIHTLCGHNWLNDEVINFYMNLLTERGETKHESRGVPTVYAMNTFFVPRLMQAGHAGVKRWTRKVDIFAKDVVPVPVHVGGVHWCMAIIHLKNQTIKYYDSMGTPNPSVLKALEQYLKDESMDKRKKTFDTSGFVIESVQGVPRQMNGSDCGVFSCMFAEYITRNRDITFSQQNMEYFRQKMILEIVSGELLQ